MAETTDTDQKVDHVAEAHLAVSQAGQYFGDEEDFTARAAAGIAQAHAQIAIAQALGGIWHQLEELNVRLSR